MNPVLAALSSCLVNTFRSRAALQIEILALRHQLAVCQRSMRRPRLRPADRILWSWIARLWPAWRDALLIVQPRTVIAWQRRRFRDHWRKLSQSSKPGRSPVAKEVRDLIRRMSSANPLWGAPKIVGELRKIGIDVVKSTVEKYMVCPRKPTSPTWKAFLKNHLTDTISIDFFVVPTVRFHILFVFLVLAHERRRVLHFNVTMSPSVEWTAQQIVEAFPWDEVPRYLLRDRDGIYGAQFRRRVKNMGIEEVMIARRSPWQNPYVERLIGTVRRECLDHVIVLNERHLKRTLARFFRYYHGWRVHQALDMDTPSGRPIQPQDHGEVVEIPELGGLHHHYERQAAQDETSTGSALWPLRHAPARVKHACEPSRPRRPRVFTSASSRCARTSLPFASGLPDRHARSSGDLGFSGWTGVEVEALRYTRQGVRLPATGPYRARASRRP